MNIKKIVGILTAAALMVSAVPALTVAADAVPEMNVNILKNGGFDQLDSSGKPVGVEFSDTGKVSLQSEEKRNGTNAVKIQTGQGESAFATLEQGNLEGGAKMQVSFWYKGSVAGNDIAVKVTEYCNNRSSYDLMVSEHRSEGKNASGNNWSRVSYMFTLQPNTSLITLSLGLFGEGTAYIDEVEFKYIELAQGTPFSLLTDWIFYYTEYCNGNGYAEVTMEEQYDASTYSADFAFKNGGAVLYEKRGIKFYDNKSRFDFPHSLLSEKKHEYTITATVKDSTGRVLFEDSAPVYKYDMPKALSRDGRIFTDKNGKQVRPTFVYHIGYDDFASAASVGINVVQYSPPQDVAECIRQLDEMYKMGVYAAVVCYWGMYPAGHPVNREKVKAFIKKIHHHPAIFCYMVMDEPFINNPNAYDDVRESYIMLREVDDYTPIYTCEGFPQYYDYVKKCCDIIAPDIYCGQWNDYGKFMADTVRDVCEMVEGTGKMVIPINQIFTYGSGAKATPTPTQVHSFIYQSYLAGTDGLGWYTWEPDNPAVDKVVDEGIYWPVLQNYYNAEADILYPYFVEGKYETFARVRDEKHWYDSFTDGEVIYTAIYNRTSSKREIEIPMVSKNGLINIADFDAVAIGGQDIPEIKAEKGMLKITLEAYAPALIKSTPKGEYDYSLLNVTVGNLGNYSWAEEAINFMHDAGIANADIEGYDFFPGENITRGDFAKYLIRTLGLQNTKATDNFADVDSGADYAKEVAIGKKLGILNGVGGGNYLPEQGISRQDLMVICARAMKYAKPVPAASGGVDSAPDGDKVAAYAKADVASMMEIGIIKGNADGTINPLGNTTRAEAAVIMQRIFNWKSA